jgi:hypothetical protein
MCLYTLVKQDVNNGQYLTTVTNLYVYLVYHVVKQILTYVNLLKEEFEDTKGR